jgi:hypothetical protein
MNEHESQRRWKQETMCEPPSSGPGARRRLWFIERDLRQYAAELEAWLRNREPADEYVDLSRLE